jgi:hypothetical protein
MSDDNNNKRSQLIGKIASSGDTYGNGEYMSGAEQIQDLKIKLASSNSELEKEKKRHELYKLIPVSHRIFRDKLTGQFNEQKYHEHVWIILLKNKRMIKNKNKKRSNRRNDY